MQKSRFIFNHFLSTICKLCKSPLNQSEDLLCQHCANSLPIIKNACIQCNTPIAINPSYTSTSATTTSNLHSTKYHQFCGVCISDQRYWRTCRSAYLYHEPVTTLIHQFKYNNHTELTSFFVKILIKSIVSNIQELPDILTHVPSHSRKFAIRGYNQSFRLTRALSKAIGIPHLPLFLKTVNTKQQTILNSEKRKKSLN